MTGRHTTDGEPPDDDRWDAPAPKEIDPQTKQHKAHFVLPESERLKGFVRPVRLSYRHEKCNTVTTQPKSIAETYAKQPSFYSRTFCCGCAAYFPVGGTGEFVWLDDGSKVGT